MMGRVVGVILLLLLLGGALALAMRTDGTKPNGDTPTTNATFPFPSSEDCAECHRAVYDEWKQSQHAYAFVNPLVRREDMADGFRKKDCIPCHAPRPVFEHGLGKSARVLARDVFRHEGVGCLSCHKLAEGGVASARSGLSGACNPMHRPEVTSTDLCAPCHNQHNTIDEWEVAPAELRGQDCNGCHMPEVDRTRADGTPYVGRFHGDRGGNDPELLRRSATVQWRFDGDAPERRIVVSVTNSGAAHNLPTDARHRAVDLVVTLLDEEGRPVGDAVDEGAGQRGGTARQRYRNPYRDEFGMVDSQIPAGETRELSIPVATDERARRVEIRLLYKRTPFVPDEDATVVFQNSVDLQ